MIKRLHQRKAVKESASPYPLTYPSSPAHKRKGLRMKPIHLGCCLCQRAAAPAQDAAALRRRAQQGGISSLSHCSRSWTYHCVFFYLLPSFVLPLSHVLAAFCSYYGNICWKYRYFQHNLKIQVFSTFQSYRILYIFTLQVQEAKAYVFHSNFNNIRTYKIKQTLTLQ